MKRSKTWMLALGVAVTAACADRGLLTAPAERFPRIPDARSTAYPLTNEQLQYIDSLWTSYPYNSDDPECFAIMQDFGIKMLSGEFNGYQEYEHPNTWAGTSWTEPPTVLFNVDRMFLDPVEDLNSIFHEMFHISYDEHGNEPWIQEMADRCAPR